MLLFTNFLFDNICLSRQKYRYKQTIKKNYAYSLPLTKTTHHHKNEWQHTMNSINQDSLILIVRCLLADKEEDNCERQLILVIVQLLACEPFDKTKLLVI